MQLKWPMRWDLFSLFPAYAGVIPTFDAGKLIPFSFPRIRGGDPLKEMPFVISVHFSPHTRG